VGVLIKFFLDKITAMLIKIIAFVGANFLKGMFMPSSEECGNYNSCCANKNVPSGGISGN
jgi:hypothetical protein